MKKILGLDLGTNSIGWALVKQDFENKKGEIVKIGSRIIPMSQDILDKFASGQSHSQTADRTKYRGVRRLYARHYLRRERLHRVLNILGFLPQHYANQIDFEKHYGKFLPETEPRLAWDARNEFIFKKSFNEMLQDFRKHQPELLINTKGESALIPYDWTIYYLRKKALTQKIEKEELAWLLLNFNQKRGYYQLRGEEEEEKPDKMEELYSLKVVNVIDSGDKKGNDQLWYNVILENGWIYRRASKIPLFDWKGKVKDFIVTTGLDEKGNVKTDNEGNVKRSFRAPKEDDWALVKKKTENDIDQSNKYVGTYIYDNLLQNPDQKIKGKLVRVIERKFYKEELKTILKTQLPLHTELQDEKLYRTCLDELYHHNEAYKQNIAKRNFLYLFMDDIIFYQRPLKTKKSEISECRYESRTYFKDGKKETIGVKCIAKSHPLFQEFRLWQWLKNLKIYKREEVVNDKQEHDLPVTEHYLKNENDYEALFEFLNNRKEVDQKAMLEKHFGLNEKTHRWNFVEDKKFPGNETYAQILSRLVKVENAPADFLNKETEEHLWHILYSVNDNKEIEQALKTFAKKYDLDEKSFVEAFRKFPPFKKEYGSYSAKAIKKLLPLMRTGKYWKEEEMLRHVNSYHSNIQNVIGKLRSKTDSEKRINNTLLSKLENIDDDIESYKGLELHIACYAAYGKHSELTDIKHWNTPSDIDRYLKDFKQHSLRNPIVEQVVTETLRTVRDIWIELGDGQENFFDEIHIELGREMKNTKDERKRLSKINAENENTNLRIKAILTELVNDSTVENVRPYSPSQQELLKIYEDGVLRNGVDIPDDIGKISKLSQPSKNDVIRYKAWLEQKYRSPYTNKIIPLNKLFSPTYEIEHIIPQSRYFDDSFSNKIICESEINKLKSNQLGFEFINNHGGQKVTLGSGETVEILKTTAYVDFVKTQYKDNHTKKKKLLMEDIPEQFIERQINDTRYISKMMMGMLSNIVREEDETETRVKNVIPCTGGITARLKQEWGFNDVWNDIITPRFKRLNEMTNTQDFGKLNPNTNKFLPKVPLEQQKGFSKKRIDHRHHALDALVIACATANHVNYLNNESHIRIGKNKEEKQKIRFDLQNNLCYKTKPDGNGNYKWAFYKPWDTITQEVREALQKTGVSFKQNLRVINTTKSIYQKWKKQPDGSMKKEPVKQKGKNWSIRKSLHKETIYGNVTVKTDSGKTVVFNKALENPEMIIDPTIRKKVIKKLKELNNDTAKLKKYFIANPIQINNQKADRVHIYEWVKGTASRVGLGTSFKKVKIEKGVTDSGIRKILTRHLEQEKYQNQKDEKGKTISPEDIAFSPEGIEDMNKNISTLNNGKFHKPIYKVRIYEAGNRFAVGETQNKTKKYVEAAKGTNLFFAVYIKNGKRNYDTVPLNEVIAHQKLVAHLPKEERTPIPVNNEKGKFLFALSPNDLVYVPDSEEIENPASMDFNNLTKEQVERVYLFVDGSGTTANFVSSHSAVPIFNIKFENQAKYNIKYSIQNEYGKGSLQSKNQKSNLGEMIKEICWKLHVNRLGKVINVIR